jgi:hypothetical protein
MSGECELDRWAIGDGRMDVGNGWRKLKSHKLAHGNMKESLTSIVSVSSANFSATGINL